MTEKEINVKIDKNNKTINVCEDALLSISTIQNSLKLLRKSLRRLYPENESGAEFAHTLNMVTADIGSLKLEIEDVASDTADETEKLKKEINEP